MNCIRGLINHLVQLPYLKIGKLNPTSFDFGNASRKLFLSLLNYATEFIYIFRLTKSIKKVVIPWYHIATYQHVLPHTGFQMFKLSQYLLNFIICSILSFFNCFFYLNRLTRNNWTTKALYVSKFSLQILSICAMHGLE